MAFLYNNSNSLASKQNVKVDKKIIQITTSKFKEVMRSFYRQLDRDIIPEDNLKETVDSYLLQDTLSRVLGSIDSRLGNFPNKNYELEYVDYCDKDDFNSVSVDDKKLEEIVANVLILPSVFVLFLENDKRKVYEMLVKLTKENIKLENILSEFRIGSGDEITDSSPLLSTGKLRGFNEKYREDKNKFKEEIRKALANIQGGKITLSAVYTDMKMPKSTFTDHLEKYKIKFLKDQKIFIDTEENQHI